MGTGRSKIKKAMVNDDYTLTVHFDNGEVKFYDMLYGVFDLLKNKAKFKKVFIDEFGNLVWDINERIDSSIYWNNRINLDADSVYLGSKRLN